MRRLIPFLFPTLIVLVSVGLLATIQRSETLRAQIDRFGIRDWIETICDEGAEFAEVTS
jgi:hypothetical protein